ncbi:MAG: abortive infection family protein [Syntrophobacteraceae bacterium]
MRHDVPSSVIAIVAEQVANSETHATLDSLFMYVGATGEPPEGSKHAKALAWLRRVNRDESVNPMRVVGKIIEGYMEAVTDQTSGDFAWERKEKIAQILASCELQYVKGGLIGGSLASLSRTLEQLIRDRDFVSINEEFDRALRSVENSPRDAVSAACNILESLCKTYIEEENLEMPTKQDLKSVWSVVRKDLGIDPSLIEDRDIQEILSGIFAVVGGIGALRTHASSAHGSGKKTYRLEPRHARLAVHASHTLTLFILESWDKKKHG